MTCDEESIDELQPVQTENGSLELEMKLTSDPRLLVVVRSTVARLAAVLGLEESQCRRITLAVDEALNNMIRHAYKNECKHEIELNCEAREECLEFTFVDHGEPADPARICSQPLSGVVLGGRGTHLVRQIMDGVRYERFAAQNRLLLKKLKPGPKKQA